MKLYRVNVNICIRIDLKDLMSTLGYFVKVVVRTFYGAYFVAHAFKYFSPNFVSGRPA